MDIDFVITWVDMNDPEWKKSFAKAKGTIDNSQNQYSEARFRDYGFLKYWFRGVEKFAPWVRKIHFVTCGQKPEWLDTSKSCKNRYQRCLQQIFQSLTALLQLSSLLYD